MNAIKAFHPVFSIVGNTCLSLKASRSRVADMDALKMGWAQRVMESLNVELKVQGQVSELNSLLFVGNHLSYLDIPLVMKVVRGASFVAKQELSRWPVFGYGAKRINTVFVDRASAQSRGAARQALEQALGQGQRVTLFPSGTTSMGEAERWRKGGFEVAHSMGAWVQPFRISYQPLRQVAFIDDDGFLPHLYRLAQVSQIKASIEFHSPVKIHDPVKDCLTWKKWCEQAPSI
jgi:lyso-ornithine lipid O-acyltransferase